MIAALYAATGGCYFGLPNVDPWDVTRDARLYAGPWPVVAHPPCSAWCQLAHVNKARYGHEVGADGGCFAAALASVRRWGGVLEHPAFSYAWARYELPLPRFGRWRTYSGRILAQQMRGGRELVSGVYQRAYGHPARKATWLYAVLPEGVQPPPLDWSKPEPVAQVSFCKNHGDSPLPRLSKKRAAATPTPFRDLLISIAESVNAAMAPAALGRTHG